MPMMNILAVYLVFLEGLVCWSSVSCLPLSKGGGTTNNTNNNNSTPHSGHGEVTFEVTTIDFNYVAVPFTIMLWILIASFAKLGKGVVPYKLYKQSLNNLVQIH
jgi:hypothetical protein